MNPDDPRQPESDPDPEDDAPARGLTRDQERAVTALMTEPTVAKAAVAAGVGERSIYRWLRDDATFMAAYRGARRDAFGAAAGVAQRLAPNALVVLAKIMNDTGANTSARVAAAAQVLKFGRDALELDDLAARVEALERSQQETKERRPWP
ncbi:MAG: hypothetical protein AB7P94_17985 [Steroidobacteraceae bacterium]